MPSDAQPEITLPRACRAARSDEAPAALVLQVALLRQARRLARRVASTQRALDPEHIHRVRTASRTLAAALDEFGPRLGGRLRKARRAIRRLARAFGRARDLDVQIAELRRRTEHAPVGSADDGRLAARAWLLERARSDRRAQRRRLREALERFVGDPAWTSLPARLVRRPYDLRGEQPVLRRAVPSRDGFDGGAPLPPQLERLTRGARAEVAVLAARLSEPSDVEAHHALRIAIKGLRAVLEVLEQKLSDALSAERAALGRLQDGLGALHDLDVGADLLAGRLHEALVRLGHDVARWPRAGALPSVAERAEHCARELGEGVPAGLCSLLRDTVARRPDLHAECVEAWSRLAGHDARTDGETRSRLSVP